MSTILTKPIVHTTEIKVQKIDSIVVNLKDQQVDIYIGDYAEDSDAVPYDVAMLALQFSEIPEGVWKENIRTLVNNMRMLSRGRGYLQAGQDLFDNGLAPPAAQA